MDNINIICNNNKIVVVDKHTSEFFRRLCNYGHIMKSFNLPVDSCIVSNVIKVASIQYDPRNYQKLYKFTCDVLIDMLFVADYLCINNVSKVIMEVLADKHINLLN